MADWIPYEWPALAPWEADAPTGGGGWSWPTLNPSAFTLADLGKWMYDLVLPALWQLAPEDMLDFWPGTDGDQPIDGGDDGWPSPGTEPPLGGGTNDGETGGAHEGSGTDWPHQQKPRATWKVIDARVAGDVDVQQMATTAAGMPGAIERGVTVPPSCGTPYVGDWGTVWYLPDGTVIFIPVLSTPSSSATEYVVTVGTTAETVAAATDTWEIYNDGTSTTGVDVVYVARMGYASGEDTPILYAYYRTARYTPRGRLLGITAEAGVALSTPVEVDCS